MRRAPKKPRRPYGVGEVTDAVALAHSDFANAPHRSLTEHVALTTLDLLGFELVRAVAGFRKQL